MFFGSGSAKQTRYWGETGILPARCYCVMKMLTDECAISPRTPSAQVNRRAAMGATESFVSFDLHPLDDTTGYLVKSVSEEGGGREEEAFYGAADHRIFEGSGSRGARYFIEVNRL